MNEAPQQTALAISDATGAAGSATLLTVFLAQFPEYTLLLVFSGLIGGIIRAIRVLRDTHFRGAGRIYDALIATITGPATALFLWPVIRPMLQPIIGQLDMEPVTAIMFGGFIAGLLGTTLIGAIIDAATIVLGKISKGLKHDPSSES